MQATTARAESEHRLHPKKQIGGVAAPVNYSFSERVFNAQATPAAKAEAKQQVVDSLRSRILSSETPPWNASTSNYDDALLTGKCYKRTNVNAEVRDALLGWQRGRRANAVSCARVCLCTVSAEPGTHVRVQLPRREAAAQVPDNQAC